ncbi:MAG: iron donor protein CyaY [Betaproteobacteria bacterium]|jgi:CyaY protein
MQIPIEKIDDTRFKEQANRVFDLIENELERIFEEDDFDVDVERQGSSVLNIKFSNHSVIVLNLQTPLHEIWLATKAGGFHFRWAGNINAPLWLDTKTDEDFLKVVSEHISKQGGIQFKVPKSL